MRKKPLGFQVSVKSRNENAVTRRLEGNARKNARKPGCGQRRYVAPALTRSPLIQRSLWQKGVRIRGDLVLAGTELWSYAIDFGLVGDDVFEGFIRDSTDGHLAAIDHQHGRFVDVEVLSQLD